MQRSLFHNPVRAFQLSKLSLSNYCAFEHFSLELHPWLTVLAAPNGGGKTAVLDALAVGLGPLLSAFAEAQRRGFRREDVRLHRASPTAIEMELCYPNATERTQIVPMGSTVGVRSADDVGRVREWDESTERVKAAKGCWHKSCSCCSGLNEQRN